MTDYTTDDAPAIGVCKRTLSYHATLEAEGFVQGECALSMCCDMQHPTHPKNDTATLTLRLATGSYEPEVKVVRGSDYDWEVVVTLRGAEERAILKHLITDLAKAIET